jgi:hypothetical protein
MGSPSLRKQHGDRATVVVVGVTTYQGMPESGMQGKGWQENLWSMARSWKAVRCVSPSLFSLPTDVFSGEPDALKGARPVRERGVGNVPTTKVRERGALVRVMFSPALLET